MSQGSPWTGLSGPTPPPQPPLGRPRPRATLLGFYVWTGVLGRGFQTPLQLPLIHVMLLYYVAIALAAIGFTTFNAR